MKWMVPARLPSVLLSVVALATVLLTVYFDAGGVSPGELSGVHARLPALQGDRGCDACHRPGDASLTEGCLHCHQAISRQLEGGSGFHGTLPPAKQRHCSTCHSEHHGPDFPITSRLSFQLAGVRSAAEFQHVGVNFQLTGKHIFVSCDRCHEDAFRKILPPGRKRFLGLSQQCTSCHDDIHRDEYGADCQSCHGQSHPFQQVALFQHTEAFRLTGAHDNLACRACHPSHTPYAVDRVLADRGSSPGESADIRSCAACHSSSHSEAFLIGTAERLEVPKSSTCQHCHRAVVGGFTGNLVMLEGDWHDATGFPLSVPHTAVQCRSCHAEYGTPVAERVASHQPHPVRRPDDCGACHRDPHQGQFANVEGGTTNCLRCHERQRFLPVAFHVAEHAATSFPLKGTHRRVACTACHFQLISSRNDTTAQPIRVFRGTPGQCRECHSDPHGGQFRGESGKVLDCRFCHDEESFQHPTLDLQHHAGTRFPLTGAHAAVSCRSCHKAEAGNPRVFVGTPRDCAACHADVHHGKFDAPGLPRFVDGRTGCARCHDTTGFRDIAAESFDHALWTGYLLKGAHATVACSACHGSQSGAALASGGRGFRHLSASKCQSCHSDPHVGQFGPTVQVDCARCHKEGSSFRDLVFDHQRDSRFRLDDLHRRLACAACHRPQKLPDGSTAIRYKPLGTQCGDCHLPSGPRPARFDD